MTEEVRAIRARRLAVPFTIFNNVLRAGSKVSVPYVMIPDATVIEVIPQYRLRQPWVEFLVTSSGFDLIEHGTPYAQVPSWNPVYRTPEPYKTAHPDGSMPAAMAQELMVEHQASRALVNAVRDDEAAAQAISPRIRSMLLDLEVSVRRIDGLLLEASS